MSHILVVGVFDLFHSGHVELLRRSRELGSRLTVLLNGDRITERYKRRPIMTEQQRLAVVQACRHVDHAVLVHGLDIRQHVVELKIDRIVHGDDWERRSYLEQIRCDDAFLAEHGVELLMLPYTGGISTSMIIDRCRKIGQATAAQEAELRHPA